MSMNKMFKKVLAVVAAGAMTMGMAMPTFAADEATTAKVTEAYVSKTYNREVGKAEKFSFTATQVKTGTGIITAALIATPFAADVKSFMAIVACYAVGMILARPNQQNIAVSMADTRALGMYLGVNSTAFAIGKGFGTIIGGASFDMAKKYTLENAPWYLYGVLVGTAMIGFMLYKNFGTPKDETEKQKQ